MEKNRDLRIDIQIATGLLLSIMTINFFESHAKNMILFHLQISYESQIIGVFLFALVLGIVFRKMRYICFPYVVIYGGYFLLQWLAFATWPGI